MARYTRSLSVALSLSNCLTQLKVVLESCNLEVLFSKEDCIIARETPGRVPFAKLVTIEVLVDSTRAKSNVTNMDIVVKNEELPLQSNNHCFQIFDQLSQAFGQHSGWNLIAEESAPEEVKQPEVSQPESPTLTTPKDISVPSVSQAAKPIVNPEPVQPISTPTQPEPDLLAPMSVPAATADSSIPTPTAEPTVFEAQKPQEPQESEKPPVPPVINVAAESQPETLHPQEAAPQPKIGDSINLDSLAQKRVQTTANLEELRQKRAESVANLERLRQKRAESIANLEKMRQKRERMFAANERDGAGDDIERPSTSQA